MLPYTSKFYCNGTIFDSTGQPSETYVSVFVKDRDIYFLRDVGGSVEKYNIDSEQIEMLSAATPASNIEVNSIIVDDQGVARCFAGHAAKIHNATDVLYIKDNYLLMSEKMDYSSSTTLLSSKSHIRDFYVDADGGYIVLHNTDQVTKFSAERLKQYTTKLTASSYGLSSIMVTTASPELLSVDMVYEYTSAGKMEYPIVLGRIDTGQMFLVKINEQSPVDSSKVLAASAMHSARMIAASATYYSHGDVHRVNYNLTNATYIHRKYNGGRNRLTFKITLKNIYNNRQVYHLQIPVDVSRFSVGFHHFVFRLNATEGLVSLFVDGREYQTLRLPSADFTFQDVTYESMSVGATYFANNIPLFDKLNQKDRYIIDNCRIKQFKIYDKAIDDDHARYLVYNGIKMGELVASIPCGQRNEIEQIERIFSFNVPGSKSNSVNIVIKNSDVTNTAIQNQIKDVIVDRLQKTLPATTRINQIVFKDVQPTLNARLST
jgi:hypothetical protein